MESKKKRALFICMHNSARSQMAEGLLRSLYDDRYEAYSAGTEPSSVNHYAIRVMAEIGVDISTHRSKSVDEFRMMKFDYVITICDHAKESCLFFQEGKITFTKGLKTLLKLLEERMKSYGFLGV